MRIAQLVALVVLSGPAAAAQSIQTLPQPQDSFKNLFGQEKKGKPGPSRPAPLELHVRSDSPTTATKPVVVCGMTLIQVDPSIDRGMIKTPRADGPKPLIKTVEPTDCKR